MTTINIDKIMGLMISAAIVTSFSLVADVNAEPVFPPPHHDTRAVFDEPTEPSATTVSGPWYLQGVEERTQDSESSFDGESGGQFFAGRSIGPWYRPVN